MNKSIYKENNNSIINLDDFYKVDDEIFNDLEEDEKINSLNSFNTLNKKNNNDNFYSDIVDLLIANANRYSLMSEEEEYQCIKRMEISKEKLVIIKNNDDSRMCPLLNMELILLSLKNINDNNILKKIKNIPFILEDDFVLKDEIKIINKYLKLFNERIPNITELKNTFPNLNFDNVQKVNEFNLSEQVDNLTVYLYSKYNLYNRNLRLSIFAAKKYKKNMFIGDAIQEANIGLIKAINKYDTTKGKKFSTYALYWLKSSVKRSEIEKEQEIRIPTTLSENFMKYNNYLSNYITKYGNKPTTKELASEIGLSEKKIRIFNEISFTIVSLNEIYSSDEEFGDSLINTIIDDTVDIEEYVSNKDLLDRLNSAINTLNCREKDIFVKRNGLNNNDVYALRDIARDYNVSYEAIRKIEKKALKKVRNLVI